MFLLPDLIYRIVFADVYLPYLDVLRAYALSGSLLSIIMLLATFHIGVSNLRIWLLMCVLLPLPIASYAIFNANPGQIAWGMVACLTVYTIYIAWETFRFAAARADHKSPPATVA